MLLYRNPDELMTLPFSLKHDARGARLERKNKLENSNASYQPISGKADDSVYPCSMFTPAGWVRGRK